MVQGRKWQVDSLCAQIDLEEFFPEKGGSTATVKIVCNVNEVQQ